MHLSVSPPHTHTHTPSPPACSPLPRRSLRPWTGPKDHLRERGDPLCYVSAREWNNTESSSANNSQRRSFSTCCLTKGKIRTDDVLSLLSLALWEFVALLWSCSQTVLCSYPPGDAGVLIPSLALLTGWYEIRGLTPNSYWRRASHFLFLPSLGWG